MIKVVALQTDEQQTANDIVEKLSNKRIFLEATDITVQILRRYKFAMEFFFQRKSKTCNKLTDHRMIRESSEIAPNQRSTYGDRADQRV